MPLFAAAFIGVNNWLTFATSSLHGQYALFAAIVIQLRFLSYL
jgi:hypothetical protein